MLALRSTLLIDALDANALAAAARSHADAVMIDLAAPSVHGQRARARANAGEAIRTIAETGRPVLVRVSDTRSGELARDLDVVVTEWTAAIVLSGAEIPQDARDADVAARKREMRVGIEPGRIRLVAEIDSAEALSRLPKILDAVDRHSAVALSIDGLREDMDLGSRAAALYGHAMADVAIAAHTSRLPWLVSVRHRRPETADLARQAHDLGAAGAIVLDEDEAQAMNALFAPDPTDVAVARATIAEWERVRAADEWVGVVAGEMPEAATYDRLVDRRTVRRARAVIAIADAIAAREATR
ncbi:MAG: aldolase/citrate lyase family protein [Chloroflexi bacterium]|nr:aldolase/citrate lyase family protein [Chloroflexota bacterium]